MGSGSISHRLRTRLAEGLFLVCGVSVAVLLGALLARLGWLILEPSGAVSRPGAGFVQAVGASGEASGSGVIRSDLSVLVLHDAFAGQAEVRMDIEAPETSLNFRLVGIRAVDGGDGGSVTLVDAGGKQGRYLPGDEIIANVRIERILPDRVVLNNKGRLESLFLGEGAGGLAVLRSDPGEAPLRPGPSEGDVVRAEVSEDFLALISVTPVSDASGGVSYVLAPRGDAQAFNSAGFAAGDVVLRINGRDVASIRPEDFDRLLREDERVILDLRRGNELVRIELAVS